MRPDDIELIRRLPLFEQVAQEHFAMLTAAAFLQRFPTHVLLIEEGARPDFLHIVVEGLVELFASHDGRESTLAFLHPVSTFILAAVVTDEPYLKSARTLAPAQILMIPAATVREVFVRDPAFARAIVTELAWRYRDVVRELKNQKLRSGTERLASWIVGAHAASGANGAFRMSFEKRTLASRLGMTPENLSRAFAALSRHGVEVKGRDIYVRRPADLAALAKPSLLMDDFSH